MERPEDLRWIKGEEPGMVIFQEIVFITIYYERKTKEFYSLELGQMTMEDLINKFLDLLRFVSYIKCVKVKMQ